MVDYKFFEAAMNSIVRDYEAYEEISKCLYKYGIDMGDMPNIGYTAIKLLERLINNKNNNIQWWVFDTCCGKNQNNNFYVINDEKFPVETIDQLWDMLNKVKE